MPLKLELGRFAENGLRNSVDLIQIAPYVSATLNQQAMPCAYLQIGYMYSNNLSIQYTVTGMLFLMEKSSLYTVHKNLVEYVNLTKLI